MLGLDPAAAKPMQRYRSSLSLSLPDFIEAPFTDAELLGNLLRQRLAPEGADGGIAFAPLLVVGRKESPVELAVLEGAGEAGGMEVAPVLMRLDVGHCRVLSQGKSLLALGQEAVLRYW